jgi:hypothetical protein
MSITNIPTFNQGPNMGGAVATFLFIPIELVAYIPPATNGNITDDILLVSGASWKSGAGVYQGNIFTETQQSGGNNPDFFRVVFRGKIPQRNAPTAALFSNMVHYRFLLLVTDANGFTWLLGHPDYEGLEFSADGSTGATAAAFNSHEFEFSGNMPNRAVTYKGTYVVDAGSCPSASVSALSGTIATVLSGGSITLSDVLEGATVADIEDAIEIDGRGGEIFVAIADEASNTQAEQALSLAQRNALSRVSLYKLGVPAVYAANDIGSNNPGRGNTFLLLSELNPNGNYNRFELLGTNVVIDWANRLYWTRFIQSPARVTWATHLTNSAALTLEGLTGWRLPSALEYMTILDQFNGNPLDYTPFNIRNGVTTGATFAFATGQTSLFTTNDVVSFGLVSASRGLSWSYSGTNKIVNTQVALYCKSF